LVRSPVGPSSANTHLATSTNIFNELQPLATAPVSVKIGLFPSRIVTRLSQETTLRPEGYEFPTFRPSIHHLVQNTDVYPNISEPCKPLIVAFSRTLTKSFATNLPHQI
jgi:hypothetical protein